MDLRADAFDIDFPNVAGYRRVVVAVDAHLLLDQFSLVRLCVADEFFEFGITIPENVIGN